MTNQQGAPEALVLATLLDMAPETGIEPQTAEDASSELRRLHAENERLAALVEAQQPAPTPQADTQPAQQGVSYAALPESFLEIPDVQDESGINAYYSREVVLECIDAALASHGQAPAHTPADSVLEDAARLDWLALAGPTSICIVLDRQHDGEVEVATDDVTGYGKTLREALDAARKQGETP